MVNGTMKADISTSPSTKQIINLSTCLPIYLSSRLYTPVCMHIPSQLLISRGTIRCLGPLLVGVVVGVDGGLHRGDVLVLVVVIQLQGVGFVCIKPM